MQIEYLHLKEKETKEQEIHSYGAPDWDKTKRGSYYSSLFTYVICFLEREICWNTCYNWKFVVFIFVWNRKYMLRELHFCKRNEDDYINIYAYVDLSIKCMKALWGKHETFG